MDSRTTVLHYPRLDTVLMIEDAIKNANDYPKRTELWKKLPKKVMYQTYRIVIDYLIDSRKVMLTRDDKLVWVFADNEKLKKLDDILIVCVSTHNLFFIRCGHIFLFTIHFNFCKGIHDIEKSGKHSNNNNSGNIVHGDNKWYDKEILTT